MGRTALQNKALGWYCEKHKYRPQLSSHPVYRFKTQEGIDVSENIVTMVTMYKDYREEEKREAKIKAREAKRKDK